MELRESFGSPLQTTVDFLIDSVKVIIVLIKDRSGARWLASS